MSPIISTQHVEVWYNNFHALKGITVDIAEKGITAFIGASGSGKSTFLRCINRMIDTVPTARTLGHIQFHDRNILSPDTDVIALRKNIGMVFQNPTPFPKSIYDNVAYGLEIQGFQNMRRGGFLRKRKINPHGLEQSLDPVDVAVVRSLKEAALWDEVKDRLHTSAFGLSGGQQQRLCIARAIAVRPEVLLLDEPCSELDPISTRKIEDLLLNLKKHYTIVIVTHNMQQARRISDSVCFFHLGELIEHGPVSVIFGNPKQELTQEYISGAFG
jgi:phosphate transport system ATP-binding protein